MVHRDRLRIDLTLDDETRKVLKEMSGDLNMPISKIVDVMAQFWRDLTFDESTLPLVNLFREKLGKRPLRNMNKKYRDIWKG